MKPEARLRARCAMLLKSHLMSPCWYSAIEHGRKHAGTPEQRAREWQRLLAQGVKPGLADMLVLAPAFVLWLEMKAGANKQSLAQEAFAREMGALAFGYEVVRSVEQLGEALQRHGIPLAANWRLAAQHHDAALDVPAKGHNKPPRARTAKPSARTLAKVAKLRAGGLVF